MRHSNLYICITACFLFLFFLSTPPLAAIQVHKAAAKGDLPALEKLIAADPALINLKDNSGSTPLFTAIENKQEKAARFFISKGADIHARSNSGDTPLHMASYTGDIPIMKLLISKGAEVNSRNSDKSVPLHWAAFMGREQAANLLIKHRADVNARNKFGYPPMQWALRGGHGAVIQLLISNGAQVKVKETEGAYYLHNGAARGFLHLVAWLLEKGADPDSKNDNGGDLLHSAASGGLTQIVAQRIRKGIAVDSRDLYGFTPLHNAAAAGRLDIVKLLLDKGAKLNLAAYNGTAPYHAAVGAGKKDIAEFLASKGAGEKKPVFPTLTGDYLGQKKPGKTPLLFAPGIVSSPHIEFGFTLNPGGNKAYFTRWGGKHRVTAILYQERRGKNAPWSQPKTAPFSGKYSDLEAVLSPEGKRLYFCSMRPLKKNDGPKYDQDIWYLEKTPKGWSEPINCGPGINSPMEELNPSIASNGTLYFQSKRKGGMGQGDIYRAACKDGKFQKAQNLGKNINSQHDELNLFVAPDESYIMFTALGRPGSLGETDIYISFSTPGGGWTPARHMGGVINSPRSEMTPFVSPDGKYLFFSSARGGNNDIYWVDASIIDSFR